MKKCIFAITFLVGCNSADNDIQTRYKETVSRSGITAIYPPREEFQVGDIFAVSYKPNNNDPFDLRDSVSVYIGESENVLKQAADHMASRIVFQRTKLKNNTTSSITEIQQNDTFHAGFSKRKAHSIQSLPIAAFPKVEADAGGTYSLGIGRLLRSLGLAGSRRTVVSLDFNDVRTYWVPKVKVNIEGEFGNLINAIFVNPGHKRSIVSALEGKLRVAHNSGRKVEPDINKRCTRYETITRVYLTRKIDYTYSNAQIIAGGLQRSREKGSTAPVTPAPINITVNANGTVDNETLTSSINTITTALATQTTAASNGESVGFTSWDARGMTFSKHFARPVAIGYESYSQTFSPFRLALRKQILIFNQDNGKYQLFPSGGKRLEGITFIHNEIRARQKNGCPKVPEPRGDEMKKLLKLTLEGRSPLEILDYLNNQN